MGHMDEIERKNYERGGVDRVEWKSCSARLQGVVRHLSHLFSNQWSISHLGTCKIWADYCPDEIQTIDCRTVQLGCRTTSCSTPPALQIDPYGSGLREREYALWRIMKYYHGGSIVCYKMGSTEVLLMICFSFYICIDLHSSFINESNNPTLVSVWKYIYCKKK